MQKESNDDKQTETYPDGYHTATPYLIVKRGTGDRVL